MRAAFICCLMLVCWLSSTLAAQVNALPEGGHLIGEVTIKANTLAKDKDAMRKIDAMVPALKKIGKGKVVRIEGSFAPTSSKAERVDKSLGLSKEVEQYLRLKHNLPLDLYLAAQDDIVDRRSRKSVRVLVYQTEFSETKLD